MDMSTPDAYTSEATINIAVADGTTAKSVPQDAIRPRQRPATGGLKALGIRGRQLDEMRMKATDETP